MTESEIQDTLINILHEHQNECAQRYQYINLITIPVKGLDGFDSLSGEFICTKLEIILDIKIPDNLFVVDYVPQTIKSVIENITKIITNESKSNGRKKARNSLSAKSS
ncbi:MAG: hypothetical protein JST55_01885 [Bacteroidetes bacterium]|nr:hypothetical protein [Bacteroidota bacterium]